MSAGWVPVIKLHEGGRHTATRQCGTPASTRRSGCAVGHSDQSVNDRYTHVLEEVHLAAAEQIAALVRKAGKAIP
jgi:hypothetical protein